MSVLLLVRVVNAPLPGVVPPIAPGDAKVAPLKLEAFRLATLVVLATENGAVPVARVETICSPVLTVVPLSVMLEAIGGLPAPPHFINVLTVPAAELAQVAAPEK